MLHVDGIARGDNNGAVSHSGGYSSLLFHYYVGRLHVLLCDKHASALMLLTTGVKIIN